MRFRQDETNQPLPLRQLLERERRVEHAARRGLIGLIGLVLATGAAIAAIVASI